MLDNISKFLPEGTDIDEFRIIARSSIMVEVFKNYVRDDLNSSVRYLINDVGDTKILQGRCQAHSKFLALLESLTDD